MICVKDFLIYVAFFVFLLIQLLFFFEAKLYVVVVGLHDVIHLVDVELVALCVEVMKVSP